MKKKLILLLLLSTVFLTGCSVDYELVVNSKKQVKEVGSFSELVSEIQKYDLSAKQFLKNKKETYQSVEEFDQYLVSTKASKEKANMRLVRWYQDFDKYLASPIFSMLYEKGAITQNNQEFMFTTTGDFYYSNLYSTEEFDMEMPMGDVNIKIRFHNKVTASNADLVDEKLNTYIWKINKDTKNKPISFTLGNEKRYDIIFLDFVADNFLYISIISVIILVVLGIMIRLFIQNRRNNKI